MNLLNNAFTKLECLNSNAWRRWRGRSSICKCKDVYVTMYKLYLNVCKDVHVTMHLYMQCKHAQIELYVQACFMCCICELVCV